MIRKKALFLIFCLTFLFISCTKNDKKAIVFSVGGAPNEIEFWGRLIEKFETQEGIEVEILRQPTDTDQRRQGLVIPLNANKNDPDVFLMDVAWIAQFAASDWLEPLDTFIGKDDIEIEKFFSKVIDLADRYKGRLTALPVYVDAGLLYYRKDLLKRYGYEGPPKTWAELVDYSLNIRKEMQGINPDFYGFVWQGAQYEGLICNFLEFAGSSGGGIMINDDTVSLNSPENVESVRFMHDLIHLYRVSPPNTFTEMKEEEVRSFFQRGDALFARNWPYAWSIYQSEDSGMKGKVGIATLPSFPSGKSVATLGGWHIGISKYSDVKDLSWEFVKFVVSYETQKELALSLGWNPARRDVYKDKDVLKRLPHFATLREVFENAVPRPNLPYYTQISEILQEYLNGVIAGKLTPEVALEKAEEEIQVVIDRYKM